MNGVGISDQLCVKYSFNCRSMKWWKKVFFWAIEVALVNSYIVYKDTYNSTTHIRYRRSIINAFTTFYLQSEDELRPAHIPSASQLIHQSDLIKGSTFLGNGQLLNNMNVNYAVKYPNKNRQFTFAKHITTTQLYFQSIVLKITTPKQHSSCNLSETETQLTTHYKLFYLH